MSAILGFAYPVKCNNRAARMPDKHIYLVSKLTLQVSNHNVYIDDILFDSSLFEVSACFVVASDAPPINDISLHTIGIVPEVKSKRVHR
jgi:hypothetical protein